MNSLPQDTIRLLGSAQVITSVYSVVKELIENAFDANATTIEIKLENFGIDKIEVRDNGHGIDGEAMNYVAKRHHTSKISRFSDLECLSTYGFRGEAVGSLCAVSDLSITSKTSQDSVGHCYRLDHQGNMISKQPTPVTQGTTFVAANLFKNVPVRRQIYNNVKKKKEELKKIEELLMAYGLIRPVTRMTLRNNKEIVWQKTCCLDTRAALLGILGRNVVGHLTKMTEVSEDSKVSMEVFLPGQDSDTSVVSRGSNDRCFIAVNNRAVQLKDLEKCIKQHYSACRGCEGRYPVCYVHVTVPPADLDVNIDPNKTRVMLHQQTSVLSLLTSVLEKLYGPLEKGKSSAVRSVEAPTCDDTLNQSENNMLNQSYDSLGSSPDMLCVSQSRCLPPSKPINVVKHSVVFHESDSVNNVTSKTTERNTSSPQNTDSSCANKYSGTSNFSKAEEVQNIFNLESDKENLDTNTGKQFIASESKKDSNNKILVDTNKEGSTQISLETCFDILDDDFSSMLNTQRPSELTLSSCLDISQDGFANISLTGDKVELAKSVHHENSKTVKLKDQLHSNNENTSGSLLNENSGLTTASVEDASSDVRLDSIVGNTEIETSLNWSKGLSETLCNGAPLQPVQLLAAGSHMTKKRPLSPPSQNQLDVTFTPPSKKLLKEQANQPKLYDMIGNSPAEKCTVGFLAFAKECRPKVVEDHPQVGYDEISALVQARWRKLPPEERHSYEASGTQHMKDLKKRVATGRKLANKLDRQITPAKGTPSIKDQLLAVRRKSDIPVKCVTAPISLNRLRQVFSTGLRLTQTQRCESCSMRVIGPLRFYNGWLCQQGDCLKVINPHRLEETLLYRQLMETHIIRATRLESPIGITEGSVGGAEIYAGLLDLVPSRATQTYTYIDDPRLKANGIEIRCHLDASLSPVLEMVGLASCMPMYSVADLKEILELIVHSEASTLYKARPLKVIYYLQGEAVRMVRQRPVHYDYDDVVHLLEQMQELLPADCTKCLHDKPLTCSVYDLADLPCTQTSQG